MLGELTEHAIKQYAGFIKNTVQPMIESLAQLVEHAERQGFPLTPETVNTVIDRFAELHLCGVRIQALNLLAIVMVIAYVCLLVLR